MKLAILMFLSSALSFAGSWSGTLVDSKCFDAEERNANPTDTLNFGDRDTNQELRYCSPGAKTKSFELVQQDGQRFQLDSAGNAEAAELIRKTGKKPVFFVTINGEITGSTIKVDSLSPYTRSAVKTAP